MTGNVKKKEREARNKELNRLRVTGNGHLAFKCVVDLNHLPRCRGV